MTINSGMMSSNKADWETPQDLFDNLDNIFGFTLDAAANPINAKCKNFFTEKKNNALKEEWHGRVWLNPPYGTEIKYWVEKARHESAQDYCELVCVLLPARTDTKYFHNDIMRASEVWLMKGRLKFVGAPTSAPFPSMIVIFDGEDREIPSFITCSTTGIIIAGKSMYNITYQRK